MESLSHSRLAVAFGVVVGVFLAFLFASQFFSSNVEEDEAEVAELTTESERPTGPSTKESEQHEKTRRRHKARRQRTPRKRRSGNGQSTLVKRSEEGNSPRHLSSLSGKVLDFWTRSGISDAEVSLDPYNIRDLRKSEWKEEDKTPEAVLTAYSSPDGTFIIKEVPAGDYKLKARADGYGEGIRSIWVPSGQNVDVPKIYLEALRAISGRVSNERYAPIPKATVEVIGREEKWKTNTGNDGRYVLEVPATVGRCSRGGYHLLFSARGLGFARVYDVPAGSSDVDVILYPEASISGRVIDSETGLPVVRARVYAVVQDLKSVRGIDPVGVGRTEVNGSYTIHHIGPGYYALWAKYGALASSTRVVRLRRSEVVQDVDLELFPSASISGNITEKGTGNPVADIRVVATTSLAKYAKTVSGDDGSYQLRGLGPGEYSVGLYMDRYSISSESPAKEEYSVLASAGSDVTGFDFIVSEHFGARLEVPARILGKVVDKSGTGIGAARLVLLGTSRSTFSNAQGRFVFDDIDTDQLVLSAEHPKHGYGLTRLKLKSGEEKGDVRIALKAIAGGISGRVTDPAGGPISGAIVTVRTDGEGTGGTTDIEGRYRTYGRVTEGLCDVYVSKEGYETASVRDVILQPNEVTLGVDFHLKSLGEHYIMGKVVDDRAVPIWGAWITATGPSTARRTETDHNGAFKIAGLKEGRYRITVRDLYVTKQEVDIEGLETGTTNLEITLKPSTGSGSIAGSIIDAQGQPVKKFTLQYINQTAQPPTQGGKYLFSELGEFLITGLEAGEYKVEAISEEGGLRKTVEGIIVKEGQLTSGVVIQIIARGHVSGAVFNAMGLPLKGAFVTPQGMTGIRAIIAEKRRTGEIPPYTPCVLTGADGTFEIEGIPQASGVSIGAWRPDYAPREVFAEMRKDEIASGIEIVLTEGGSVRGIVRDGTGTPLPRVSIYTSPPLENAETDDNGSFRIEKLLPGKYWLNAYIRLTRRATKLVEIKEGEESYVELVLSE